MNSVRDLVLHMYSLVHKALVLEISKDVKKDRKAHLSCKMAGKVTVNSMECFKVMGGWLTVCSRGAGNPVFLSP